MREPAFSAARRAREIARALALAGLGGVAFAAVGLPAPWLSGGMVGVTLGLFARLDLHLPPRLNDFALPVLGLSMGVGVTPESLAAMGQWPASLAALVVAVIAIMAVAAWVVARWGWDRETAFYASAPGALSTVLALASQSGADVRRVTVAQSIRLFALVAILPSLVAVLDPSALAAPPSAPPAPGLVQGPLEYAVIAGAGALGMLLFHLLRVPSAPLLGAFVGSAVVHGAGIVTAAIPDLVLVPAFVILGAIVALRFKGVSRAALRADLAASLASLAASSLVAIAAAGVVAKFFHVPLAEALVAFAPGGLEAMVVVAFALKLDIAYVSVHHLVRFLGIAFLLPLAAPLFTRRPE